MSYSRQISHLRLPERYSSTSCCLNSSVYLRGFRRCFCSVIKSAPSCIYYRLYDLKKSVQLIVTYPGDNVPIDIIARAEDASKIQRIVERFELGKVDKAAIVTESQKAVEKREALEKDKPTKTKNEIITEEAVRKPIQKEGYSQSNPTVAKTDKNPPSRHDYEPVDMQTDKGTVSDRQRKPSVKAKLDRYKAQSKQQKEAERKEPEVTKPEVKNAPAQTVHQQPKPKSKNVKER